MQKIEMAYKWCLTDDNDSDDQITIHHTYSSLRTSKPIIFQDTTCFNTSSFIPLIFVFSYLFNWYLLFLCDFQVNCSKLFSKVLKAFESLNVCNGLKGIKDNTFNTI